MYVSCLFIYAIVVVVIFITFLYGYDVWSGRKKILSGIWVNIFFNHFLFYKKVKVSKTLHLDFYICWAWVYSAVRFFFDVIRDSWLWLSKNGYTLKLLLIYNGTQGFLSFLTCQFSSRPHPTLTQYFPDQICEYPQMEVLNSPFINTSK